MLGIVNKLKESSMKTIASVASSVPSWHQLQDYLPNQQRPAAQRKRHSKAEAKSLLTNGGHVVCEPNCEYESDESEWNDNDDESDHFLTDLLEILNVDPERRNDREEIRRKLAMGTESDDYYGSEKMTKKPSLSTRLQSGMNLQICFMNETASDHESQGSDQDANGFVPFQKHKQSLKKKNAMLDKSENLLKNKPKQKNSSMRPRPSFFKESLNSVFQSNSLKNQAKIIADNSDVDFLTKQAHLQAEARIALAQAKEMAHMQMEIEKQRKKKSPIAEMVGLAMPDFPRRLSRQVLTGMNVAQLQVIVNDFHTQIETLNEDLVKFLLERDDLHMEQDSMLVDIEDLTRYLGDKEEIKKQGSVSKKYKRGKK